MTSTTANSNEDSNLSPNHHIAIDCRQLATVLAALRHWQKSTDPTTRLAFPHFNEITPLDNVEIDVLCEDINSFNQEQVTPFVLHDCGRGQGHVEGKIRFFLTGIEIFIDGYGTKTMQDGHGSPVYIEFYEGSLRVLVWSDINQEDPTHAIALLGAKENKRRD